MALVLQWLDDNRVVTFAATIGVRGRLPDPLAVDVITCDVDTGRCEVIGHDAFHGSVISLPTGRFAALYP